MSKIDSASSTSHSITNENFPSGKIDINMDTCLESYPCQHKVTIDGVQTLMDGVEIFGWFVENGQEVPEHFKEYEKQYRQDHPLVKSANKC